MEDMGWHAIINGKITKGTQRAINRLLQPLQIDSSTSTFQGEVKELLENSKRYEGIISIGGDGTLSEVINGIDLEGQKILVAPAGTINCFARFIGVKRIEQGMNLIETGKLDINVIREMQNKGGTI